MGANSFSLCLLPFILLFLLPGMQHDTEGGAATLPLGGSNLENKSHTLGVPEADPESLMPLWRQWSA